MPATAEATVLAEIGHEIAIDIGQVDLLDRVAAFARQRHGRVQRRLRLGRYRQAERRFPVDGELELAGVARGGGGKRAFRRRRGIGRQRVGAGVRSSSSANRAPSG